MFPADAVPLADGIPLTDLPEAVRGKARADSGAPAFTYVDHSVDRAGTAHTLSYGELDRRARSVAAELTPLTGPDDRVALLAPQGLDFLVGFLGCLYAGRACVPLHAPEPFRPNDRLKAVLADSAPRCVLTVRDQLGPVKEVVNEAGPGDCRLLCLDDLDPANDPHGGADPGPTATEDPDRIAYLQYTSGSTSTPRGVLVSRTNLAAAAWQAAEQSDLTDADVIVSWLPYFHDMGLILGVAMPLSAGAHAVHLAPMAFVQRPARWLELISHHRGTWSAAPNFALDLCVRRVTGEHKRALRLDSLRVLCNGSEQVNPDSVRAFEEAFAECGFELQGHAPGYGLAEATLGVATAIGGAVTHAFDRAALNRGEVRPDPADPADAWRIVSCGVPFRGLTVRIVDPETGTELPPDRAGEVWVSGPNIARGYFGRPEESAATFQARLTPRTGERTGPHWLRTGDLGFLLDGELVIMGRLKETIVVDGRNHYPADIEATAEQALHELNPLSIAAFPLVGDDGERLVVAVELRQRPDGERPLTRDEWTARLRREIGVRHGIEPYDVLLLRGGALPKTSSGKVRRKAGARRYADGALRELEISW